MSRPSSDYPRIEISRGEVDLVIKALTVYNHHVTLLNSGAFPISEDDLADLNNDCEYLKGLIRNLELQRSKT